MLEPIVIISLIITGVYSATRDGMLLGPARERVSDLLDWAHLGWLKRPLFDCNICMGGIYTLVLYPLMWGLNWLIFPVMVGVIGLNTIIAYILKKLYYE